MIKLIDEKVYFINNDRIVPKQQFDISPGAYGNFGDVSDANKNTISYGVLKSHNTAKGTDKLSIKFDSLASHDITYVGVIQTAKASGLSSFPVPYVLTNCHNSLCAVGGTINEDDHMFGLSAAKKYGGIFVPAHLAVIHQYMREMLSGCGRMILGSDSHTRYGALGTMAIGEGGPEIVKQLLSKTYDIEMPEIVAVHMTGAPKKGVGPQDIALAIIGAVFANGFVKNKIMEFVGQGIYGLEVDFRSGIDVMTTETTCLSSIWQTDDKVKKYYAAHGRESAYKKMQPGDCAMYDGAIIVDLSKIEPMVAMPFHPSNVYKLRDVLQNPGDIVRKVEKDALENEGIHLRLTDKVIGGALHVEQGIIAGCAGGIYGNIMEAAQILGGAPIGNDSFSLNVYPASQPVYIELVKNGSIASLMQTGAVIKTAFCGPCFGAGDVPANNQLSIRHTTRNFPNREGAKPGDGQLASVALMDARSIAATALSGGKLTSAADIDYSPADKPYNFDSRIYDSRVYYGFNKPDNSQELKYGPNIADWPELPSLADNVLLELASVINDPVTTTDELIPSGETSSYRSNPHKLAEFTLSRRDPGYVGRSKKVRAQEVLRAGGNAEDMDKKYSAAISAAIEYSGQGQSGMVSLKDVYIASAVYAVKPGDGSAREQAASCQRVLGGAANIAREYATKRYRSNLINWGMLPFLSDYKGFETGDLVFIPNVRTVLLGGKDSFDAYIVRDGQVAGKIVLTIGGLNDTEKQIILDGCLINYYSK